MLARRDLLRRCRACLWPEVGLGLDEDVLCGSNGARSGGVDDDGAPNMPLAMCMDIGRLEQWYIQIPARVAVKRLFRVSPGAMVRIGPSGASALGWKSME